MATTLQAAVIIFTLFLIRSFDLYYFSDVYEPFEGRDFFVVHLDNKDFVTNDPGFVSWISASIRRSLCYCFRIFASKIDMSTCRSAQAASFHSFRVETILVLAFLVDRSL